VSKYGAERVGRRFGIEVKVGNLEAASLQDRQFDAVHMSHVLEHLPDPHATLLEVHRILKPGGVIGIEVPNEFENLGTRTLSALGLARPYPVRSTHIWFFSPSTLKQLVSRAGLEITRLRTFRDMEEPSPVKKAAKQAFRLVEEPLGMAPLIELLARKPPVE
jgi:ubiquinone/menaquinone biosynthesis C-methylase UbiE